MDNEQEIERLKSELKAREKDLAAMKSFADLWYFVMDEAPLKFEAIVNNYTPARWMDEAYKLMRGAK